MKIGEGVKGAYKNVVKYVKHMKLFAGHTSHHLQQSSFYASSKLRVSGNEFVYRRYVIGSPPQGSENGGTSPLPASLSVIGLSLASRMW